MAAAIFDISPGSAAVLFLEIIASEKFDAKTSRAIASVVDDFYLQRKSKPGK
ncbi:hypothetical protein [Methylocystis parvus]|nr:hypothetical protein [Methylocystis parvus]WBK01900.1 hypothetical protein MMG94_09435 [Methylocystis parvus OBBP]